MSMTISESGFLSQRVHECSGTCCVCGFCGCSWSRLLGFRLRHVDSGWKRRLLKQVAVSSLCFYGMFFVQLLVQRSIFSLKTLIQWGGGRSTGQRGRLLVNFECGWPCELRRLNFTWSMTERERGRREIEGGRRKGERDGEIDSHLSFSGLKRIFFSILKMFFNFR